MRARLALCLILVLVTSACAGRAWRSALSEDTAASYHRFLRDHPDSAHAAEARARLAFVRVRNKPSVQGFERFRSEFPESSLLAELRPHVEEELFRRARARGSVRSYRRFLEEIPDGRLAARARGNLEYLENAGFGGDVRRLGEFAKRHPESDFAAEALRSVASVEQRHRGSFRAVALVIDVPASVPEADRLRRVFGERAALAYRSAGIALVDAGAPADATLTIAHREAESRSEFDRGTVTQSAVVARTRLELTVSGEEKPVWSDQLDFRIPISELSPGESALFHPRARTSYWQSEFFAPVASWNTSAAARPPKRLPAAPVAVAMLGSRSIVLFATGDLQIVDLSDPEEPLVLGEYRRPRDLATFEGVVELPGALGLYGPDGIEVIAFEDEGLSRTRAYPRDQVGSVVALVPVPGGMVSAGNRGLLWLGDDGTLKTLVSREILGLGALEGRLVFTEGISLFVASVALLERGRVEGELRMGRGFAPGPVRVSGSDAIVIGAPGLVHVDLSLPSRPRVVSRLDRAQIGEVRDAALVEGRIFVLGPRGLQVSDPSGERVVDSVDVTARGRLDVNGRHVVLVGSESLQVVDATPFAPPRPASVER